jgi:hypothetical protein
MGIALASTPTGNQYAFFAILRDLKFDGIRLYIPGNSTKGNLQDDRIAVSTCPVRRAASVSVFSQDMLAVFQVQQSPELGIATQDDTPATSTISAIRTTARIGPVTMKMHGSCATCS